MVGFEVCLVVREANMNHEGAKRKSRYLLSACLFVFIYSLNLCEPMRRSFGQSEPAQDCAEDDVFAFARAGRRLMIKNKTAPGCLGASTST